MALHTQDLALHPLAFSPRQEKNLLPAQERQSQQGVKWDLKTKEVKTTSPDYCRVAVGFRKRLHVYLKTCSFITKHIRKNNNE